MRRTEKIVSKAKYDRRLGCFVIISKGQMSQYHTKLAAAKLNLGEVEPTLAYKLRRFCKRIGKTALAKIDKALNRKKVQREQHIVIEMPLRMDLMEGNAR